MASNTADFRVGLVRRWVQRVWGKTPSFGRGYLRVGALWGIFSHHDYNSGSGSKETSTRSVSRILGQWLWLAESSVVNTRWTSQRNVLRPWYDDVPWLACSGSLVVERGLTSAGSDSVAHMAEEVKDAGVIVPKVSCVIHAGTVALASG